MTRTKAALPVPPGGHLGTGRDDNRLALLEELPLDGGELFPTWQPHLHLLRHHTPAESHEGSLHPGAHRGGSRLARLDSEVVDFELRGDKLAELSSGWAVTVNCVGVCGWVGRGV